MAVQIGLLEIGNTYANAQCALANGVFSGQM